MWKSLFFFSETKNFPDFCTWSLGRSELRPPQWLRLKVWIFLLALSLPILPLRHWPLITKSEVKNGVNKENVKTLWVPLNIKEYLKDILTLDTVLFCLLFKYLHLPTGVQGYVSDTNYLTRSKKVLMKENFQSSYPWKMSISNFEYANLSHKSLHRKLLYLPNKKHRFGHPSGTIPDIL